MIQKLNPLPKVPYVDGVPTDSIQTPIKWILNGETLEGAETKTSNEGNLNKIGVEIQQNVIQLESNTDTHTSKINEVIDQVNLISSNLSAISDENVVEKLDKAVEDIAVLKIDVSELDIKTGTHSLKLKSINDEIGEYDPVTDPKHRTLRNDIIFLKTDLGAYAGFDVNGDVDPSSTGSGLKYKVMQNALAVSIQEGRLTKLEDEWALSDVGQLTQEFIDLRNEVGPKGLATLDSVYVRLNKINGRIDTTNTEINTINDYIGRTGSGTSGSLVSRVANTENEINSIKITLYDSSNGLVTRVNSIDASIGSSTTPGGVKYDIAQVKRDIMDINMIVGESSDEGLRGEMAIVMTDIGSDSESLSIKGRILNLENTSRDNTSRLIDLESRVGNTSSGLVAANLMIGKDLYGDSTSSDPFTKDGIKKSLQTTMTEIGSSASGSQTGIYKLISDLTNRVVALENDNVQLKADLLMKADVSKFIDYYTKIEADNKFESKNIPLSFSGNVSGNTSYVEGDSFALNVSVIGGTTPYSYQWKKGSVNVGIDSPIFNISSLVVGDAGTYSVVVTDANNDTITSNTLTITVTPQLIFTTDLPATKTATIGENFDLEPEITGGISPYSYYWTKDGVHHFDNDQVVSVDFSNAQASSSGVWQVKITDSAGNEITSTACTVTIS